ncbi:MAG TPA: response regulator transcription factor [Actinomycetales bacterium]|jgi:DNA-binding NarL/FixJ family response regulator
MAALVDRVGLAPLPRTGRFTALVVVSQLGAREAISRTLRALGAREVVQAATVNEARQRAGAMGPRELCIIDVTLADGSGLALLTDLRSRGWQRAVVLSSLDDPYTVRAALSAGVRCFLVSGRASTPTVPAPTSALGEQLSGREIEVLQHVANGRSNKEIGVKLGLSALTVKSHLARIARKLGTGDRAEMVMLALRAGVIS